MSDKGGRTLRRFHWIASYPKSGNTWLRLALSSLRRDGAPHDFSEPLSFAPFASARVLFDAALDIDSSDLTEREVTGLRPRAYEVEAWAATEPLLRKVHDAWVPAAANEPLFPPSMTLSTLYVVRDPRDTAVSLASHQGMSLDAAITFMGDRHARLSPTGRSPGSQLPQQLLSWSDHVESWLDAPGMPAPLLIRYEDMVADPEALLTRAARHLGWTAERDAVGRAIAATTFEALRAQEDRHGFSEKPRTATRFFRRGIVGGWRDTLSQAQADAISRRHGAVMERLGYRP